MYIFFSEGGHFSSSGGRVTAKGRGECILYVFAHNGVAKQVRITVR